MKKQLLISLFLAVVLCACGGATSYTRKPVMQGIDYSNYAGNEAYYEFTSDIPDVDMTQTPAVSEADEVLGEDEDFTSENLANSYRNYGDVVVTVAKHKFKLGDNASRQDMTLLMQSIESSYTKALRTYRPSSFTYAMSSVGAVNPLSEVEVSCRLGERAANEVGQATCKLFFNSIREDYLKRVQEVKK